jgi:hypothetical protein
MSTLSPQELEELFHPTMEEPSHWTVIRYEVDLGYETGCAESVLLTFQSASGSLKRLKFSAPRALNFSCQLPQSLYVAEMSSLGWENGQQIEVGEWGKTMQWCFGPNQLKKLSNRSAHADTQQQDAAARQLLRAGGLQR